MMVYEAYLPVNENVTSPTKLIIWNYIKIIHKPTVSLNVHSNMLNCINQEKLVHQSVHLGISHSVMMDTQFVIRGKQQS